MHIASIVYRGEVTNCAMALPSELKKKKIVKQNRAVLTKEKLLFCEHSGFILPSETFCVYAFFATTYTSLNDHFLQRAALNLVKGRGLATPGRFVQLLSWFCCLVLVLDKFRLFFAVLAYF